MFRIEIVDNNEIIETLSTKQKRQKKHIFCHWQVPRSKPKTRRYFMRGIEIDFKRSVFRARSNMQPQGLKGNGSIRSYTFHMSLSGRVLFVSRSGGGQGRARSMTLPLTALYFAKSRIGKPF